MTLHHLTYSKKFTSIPPLLAFKLLLLFSSKRCKRRGLGRSPGVGNSNPLQYCCQENSKDTGAWAGCSPWGHKESDMTGATEHAQ